MAGVVSPGSAELHLHLLEALLHQRARRFGHMLQRIRAHQCAARISGHAFAETAQQRRERQAERFALDVPQRHVDGREREREDPARPG